MIQSKNDNSDVYYKIRISNPISDSEGKLKHTVNGISANSWLTPIGISQRTDTVPYGPITEEIRTIIQERAQSAGAVLGRRHFEIDKQEVKKDEILRGHRLDFKTSESISKEKIVHSGRFCGRKCKSSYAEYRSKFLSDRPNTSYNTQASQPLDTESLHVRAEPICTNKNNKLDEKRNNKNYDINSMDKEENSPFRSFSEMKIAYRNRIKSAPALLTKAVPQDVPVQQDKNKTRTVPVYWKARTVYHRRQMANCGGEEFEDNFVYFTKGSLLRPLMHSEGTALRHSAGCPYKCKGCFRACLVSQDYYDKIKQRKSEKTKQKLVRPSFYHRRILELALAKLQPINKIIENEKIEKLDQEKEKSVSNCSDKSDDAVNT